MIYYIFSWLIFALIGAGIGHRKKRIWDGFFAGLLLGPIGLILLLLLKPKYMCPECGGAVEKGFEKCMHCGSVIGNKIINTDAPIPCHHCGEPIRGKEGRCWACGEFINT